MLLVAALPAALWFHPPVADAQHARERLVVSIDWLAEHLNDPRLVLVQVGPEEDYQKEHIPGARYLSHRHPQSPDGLILEMQPPEAVQRTFRDLGISEGSRVVVYRSSEWVSPATRVLFEFSWAGVDAVFLDGGLDAWKAAGHPVTAEVPAVTPGNVTVKPRTDLIVTADWVQQHALKEPGFAVLDGRSRAFYDGVRDDRGKSGHIPGAGSLPWVELFEESGALKDAGALRALFTEAGVKPGDTVVAYCHIGQFATAVILAARTLGHEVRLYDGAMQDWAQRDLPVTTAAR